MILAWAEDKFFSEMGSVYAMAHLFSKASLKKSLL